MLNQGNSVLLNTRIDSLASHCMKFVDLGSSQSTMMNFKNDVEYFSQEFSKKVKCEDDFCGRLLFLLQVSGCLHLHVHTFLAVHVFLYRNNLVISLTKNFL